MPTACALKCWQSVSIALLGSVPCPCEKDVFNEECSSLPESQSLWGDFGLVDLSAARCWWGQARVQLGSPGLRAANLPEVTQDVKRAIWVMIITTGGERQSHPALGIRVFSVRVLTPLTGMYKSLWASLPCSRRAIKRECGGTKINKTFSNVNQPSTAWIIIYIIY